MRLCKGREYISMYTVFASDELIDLVRDNHAIYGISRTILLRGLRDAGLRASLRGVVG